MVSVHARQPRDGPSVFLFAGGLETHGSGVCFGWLPALSLSLSQVVFAQTQSTLAGRGAIELCPPESSLHQQKQKGKRPPACSQATERSLPYNVCYALSKSVGGAVRTRLTRSLVRAGGSYIWNKFFFSLTPHNPAPSLAAWAGAVCDECNTVFLPIPSALPASPTLRCPLFSLFGCFFFASFFKTALSKPQPQNLANPSLPLSKKKNHGSAV